MKFIKGRQLKEEKGFTLMELMVVVLILGIIAAYAVPRYLSSIATSKMGMVIANYDAVKTEVWCTYYHPGYDQDEVASLVVTNSTNLENPFDSSRDAVVQQTDGGITIEGGQIVVDPTTDTEVMVTAYDNSATPASVETEVIRDPKE